MAKKKNNNIIPVIVALGLVTIAVVSGISIYSAYNKSISTETTGGMQTNITEVQGINIRRLTSGTDGSGNPYQTFQYETVPTYTKNACNVTLSFQDGRNNPTDYLTLVHNAESRTVTVTCLAAFDSQATISFTSGNASADVTVDYYQKFIDVQPAGTGACYRTLTYNAVKYNPGGGITTDTHDSISDLLSVFYSSPLYYVNKTSTYTVALTGYDNAYFTGLSVPTGLGYSTYEDYIDTTGYAANKLDVYTYFWKPAFANLNIANDVYGTDVGFTGIYKALNTVWATLSDAQKQKVVTYSTITSNNSIYLEVELPKIKNMTANVYFPDVTRNAPYSFSKELTLDIEPMPSWDIGLNATSISVETPNINF